MSLFDALVQSLGHASSFVLHAVVTVSFGDLLRCHTSGALLLFVLFESSCLHQSVRSFLSHVIARVTGYRLCHLLSSVAAHMISFVSLVTARVTCYRPLHVFVDCGPHVFARAACNGDSFIRQLVSKPHIRCKLQHQCACVTTNRHKAFLDCTIH